MALTTTTVINAVAYGATSQVILGAVTTLVATTRSVAIAAEVTPTQGRPLANYGKVRLMWAVSPTTYTAAQAAVQLAPQGELYLPITPNLTIHSITTPFFDNTGGILYVWAESPGLGQNSATLTVKSVEF